MHTQKQHASKAEVVAHEIRPTPTDRIVFFDGECVLCNGFVDRLLRADHERRFMVASLQGETAARARDLHPEFPSELETIALWDRGALYLRSRAVLRVMAELPYPYRALGWLRIFPTFIADAMYRLVAKLRYRLFGRRAQCRVPTPEERDRILP